MLSQLEIDFYKAMDNLSKSDSIQDKAKYTRISLELAEEVNKLEE